MSRYRAQYVLADGAFRDAWAVEVTADGRIAEVGPARSDDVDLGAVAIIPGLVNAHSHSFQRVIRGRTEWLDPSRPDEDFWTWRERMYGAAARLDPDSIYDVARWTFLEMLSTGITTVGEFHYVHHQPGGVPYEDRTVLARRVVAAARDVGIRIVLLRVAYQRGGFGRPAAPEQLRFIDADVDAVLADAETLASDHRDDDAVAVGLAPHSIRAVDRRWLEELGAAARRADMPLHIHACEQRREIDESRAEYGVTPLEAFDEFGILDDRLTLVHATHLSEPELALAASRRPTVCACPTTERNLGDGFLPASRLVQAGVPICLGSDSHADIDLFEEARLVEYHERLRHERRNVLAAAALSTSGSGQTAAVLWPMLAAAGARSLRQNVGTLRPGAWADFATLDLNHPTLLGADRDSLLTHVCLSTAPAAVRDVFVGGRHIIRDRRHPARDDAAAAFLRSARELR